jgi:predicted transposase YbfD/YdcC
MRIQTVVRDLNGENPRTEVRFGVTSLTTDQARRARLLELSRSHWSIENKVHWVRDVTFDEDRSQVRRGAAAHVMASLRNISMNLFRLADCTNIAEGTRHVALHPEVAARLLGIQIAA